MSEVLVVLGTRPEIIKMGLLIKEMRRIDIDVKIAHTGQQSDAFMNDFFMKAFDLKPDVEWRLKETTPVTRLSSMMTFLDTTINRLKPRMVLVEGDTDSVLAGGLVANKKSIMCGHVEAGLRSYDLRMPEEHNRRIVDHISNFLFAPTTDAAKTLINENVWGEVSVVGNTSIDACEFFSSRIVSHNNEVASVMGNGEFLLATLHRQESVDHKEILESIFNAFLRSPLRIIIPIHPRTKNNLINFGLWDKVKESKKVVLVEPVDYLTFIWLMKNCKFILSDSGGVQEEATAPSIRKRVIVLRDKTDRNEAVVAGFAELVGTNTDRILSAIHQEITTRFLPPQEQSPYGEGYSSIAIAVIVKEILQNV